MQIRGNVMGGQQPVTGSSIFLYTAGKTGNASSGTPILIVPVKTDGSGNFSLTADYTCANVNDQVLLVAQGGNPGLGGNAVNPALVLVNAFGRCGDLLTTQFVTINEVTTAAAAWALAPFITSANKVGATATNAAGIANAFLNAHLLADPTTGDIPKTPAANLTIESSKLYALANAIAGCTNSDGTTGCAALFAAATPPGGSAPTDTFKAALNIVRNPGNNVAAVYNVISATPPFPATLTAAPNDWTMSLDGNGGRVSCNDEPGADGVGH